MVDGDTKQDDPRRCAQCGAVGILSLTQPRDEGGRIVEPAMLCPVCDEEFTATGMTWMGAVPVDAIDELSDEEFEALVDRVAEGLAGEFPGDVGSGGGNVGELLDP
jgi:hypothetical protein